MDSFSIQHYTARLRICCRNFLNDNLKKYNVTSSEGKYLGMLADRGAMSQNEMSEILGYDKAYTSRVITSLLAKGLIQEKESEDCRRKVFEISKQGKELGEIVHNKMDNFIDKCIFDGISSEEKQCFLKCLKIMFLNSKKIIEGEINNVKDIKKY